ncbi:dormancy-associated protein homolog 3 isoform X1 [Prunus persica]|uniref:dormancy-associated protein homolog 3 isoform X1 n=1 Tax=Prunus persica TaxID=3760 RepID=UPI0009AB1EA3|nr:dormancy-associated protein homolog 3 isoform X1 [Prunus persica]
MGLLDQLWDDTVAGPRPDIGLGKLRKHKTFSFRSSSAKGSSDGGSVGSYGEDSTEEATRVTRSIMIVKPPGYGSGNSGSPPISPAGSTPPVSPFSAAWEDSGGGRHRMHTRRQARLVVEEQGAAPGLLSTCDQRTTCSDIMKKPFLC